MSFKNTATYQNTEIYKARESDHISNLVDIIEDLDNQLSGWIDAAKTWNCEDPGDLINKIEDAKKKEES